MNLVTEAPLPGHELDDYDFFPPYEFDEFFQPELESEDEPVQHFFQDIPSNTDDVVVGSEIYHRLVADFMV